MCRSAGRHLEVGFLLEGLDALAERAVGGGQQQQDHAQRQDDLRENLNTQYREAVVLQSSEIEGGAWGNR